MLVRAAGRKAHHKAIANKAIRQQSFLPFLYPTIHSNHIDQRRGVFIDAGPQESRLRKRRNSRESSAGSSSRSLATATHPLDDGQFNGTYALSNKGIGPMNFRISERPAPIIINNNYSFHDSLPIKHKRESRDAVGGTAQEVISIFDACIQVGRIERAAVVFKRLCTYTEIDPEVLLELQNRYLRAAVENLIMKPSETDAQALHKWFELEVRHKGLLQDTMTIAYMLKASLQSPSSARRNRLVERYMDMVQGDDGLQVLSMGILGAEDLDIINHICPKYNLAEGLGEAQQYLEADVEQENVTQGSEHSKQSTTDMSSAEVRPTAQKGLGLKSLKQSLSLFSNFTSSGMDLSKMSEEEKRDIQTQLEQDSVQSAIDRWRDENANLTKMGLNSNLQSRSLGARMWQWQVALSEILKDELSKIDEAEAKKVRTAADTRRCAYGPFIRFLSADKLAAVTILSMMGVISTTGIDRGVALAAATMAVAKNIENECYFVSMQNTRDKNKTIWRDSKQSLNPRMIQVLKKRADLMRDSGSLTDIQKQPAEATDSPSLNSQWSATIRAEVGSFLVATLLEAAKIPVTLKHPETNETVTQMQPAFSHSQQYRNGKKTGVIITNKPLAMQLMREPVHSLLAKHLPMLVKPEPWTGFSSGGFLSHPGAVMRVKHGNSDQKNYANAAIGRGNMKRVFEGLNVLGQQSWRINQPVFDTMLEAWNSGEAIANIAPENPKFDYPPEPDASTDPLERRRWVTAVKKIENTKGAFHSQRCFQNFQLEIARALRNKVFYFPHNVDFRGRAYPIPPYLNHMGADHCRGLLKFGVGKELGTSGLKWLKVHLANVFGFDKASLKEREEFTNQHIDDIYDSAVDPLGGNRWWLTAEDSWQCLAACIELKNALELDDPTRFVSYLPVHQDGTCNGLQHYAALGGDVWGAQQVNLEPGDRPADVYTAVADLVKESIAKDVEAGDPLAKLLDGKITRKVVKQTVMTNVYGVTFIGAKAQVRKQLVASFKDMPETPELNAGTLSGYVAVKIFTALATMFKGAHDIQYWLGECATRVSKSLAPEQVERLPSEVLNKTTSPPSKGSKGSKDSVKDSILDDSSQFKTSVIWTTPLDMPVVQPYRNSKSRSIITHLQVISLVDPHQSDPVNARKQLQAFPPNFIHSLDATHMLLSAAKCNQLNLSFAAVHDSFWTHACDVDVMNSNLRDAFIEIHTDDVIGRLAAELSTRYQGFMRLVTIKGGTPLHKKIMEHRKSSPKSLKGKHQSLLQEMERLRLLRSTNPEDVEKGKKMVTAGSIYEEMAQESDHDENPEIKSMGLGNMSRSRTTDEHEAVQEMDTGTMEEVMEEVIEEREELAPESMKYDFENLTKARVPRKAGQEAATWVWIPLKFTPPPQKGDFDVTRLSRSQYFFS